MKKVKTRLFLDEPLAEGGEVKMGRDRTHFLTNVLRLKAGDIVSFFNAGCGEWSATIENLSKRHGVARLEGRMRPPHPEPGPWLAFAPVKKTRTDFIVEKATELGARKLIPVFTKFTATDRVNVGRLRAIAVEAAEQCKRLSIPEIVEPCSLEELIAEWPGDRILFVGDEKGDGTPLAVAFAGADHQTALGFLIGPEGGFGDDELAALMAQRFCQTVDLGPRILRAETAAIAVLSVWNALTGR